MLLLLFLFLAFWANSTEWAGPSLGQAFMNNGSQNVLQSQMFGCGIKWRKRNRMAQNIFSEKLWKMNEGAAKQENGLQVYHSLGNLDWRRRCNPNLLWDSTVQVWTFPIVMKSISTCFIQISPFMFPVRNYTWFFLSSPRHCNVYIEALGWMLLTKLHIRVNRIRFSGVFKLSCQWKEVDDYEILQREFLYMEAYVHELGARDLFW